MSTGGGGEVAALGLVVVVAPAVAALGVAVGAGILIGRGLMWCGEKLEENYQHACQEWTNVAERAHMENMQNIQEMTDYMVDQLDLTATVYSTVNPITASVNAYDANALHEALARTRQAFDDAQTFTQGKDTSRQALMAQRLHAEIEAGRRILPPQAIARAEAALQASPEEIQRAITQLQAAWSSVTEVDSLRKRQERQARQIIRSVRRQLAAIDAMTRTVKSSTSHDLDAEQGDVETQVRDAELSLDIHPAEALDKARKAEVAARELMEAVSATMISGLRNRRKEIHALRGMLKSLEKMLQEARALQLLGDGQLLQLGNRIQNFQTRLNALEKEDDPAVPHQFARLKANIGLLKQDVFAVVKVTQQHSVAQTIATTMAEFGFTAGDGSKPAVKQQGDKMRVMAMVNKEESPEKRDEKIVSFDIGPDGAVAYDFSGYAGDSCIPDAKRIFASLREKGVYILDKQGWANLRRLPEEDVTPEALQAAQFEPRITKNKVQADLAESLKHVLEKMGYPTIQQRVIGGSIELEAFKGQIGYRVVLPPEGEARILKDAQLTDVSRDAGDPIAEAALRTIRRTEAAQVNQDEEEDEQEEQSQQRGYTAQTKAAGMGMN
jgi:hypothetical protein